MGAKLLTQRLTKQLRQQMFGALKVYSRLLRDWSSQMLARMLKSWRYDVIAASDGDEARAILQQDDEWRDYFMQGMENASSNEDAEEKRQYMFDSVRQHVSLQPAPDATVADSTAAAAGT